MAAPSPQAKHSLTQTATNRLAAPQVRRLFTFAYLSPLSLPLVYCFLHSSLPLLFGNFHEKCRSYMVHDIADVFDYTTIWQERMSRKLQNLPLSPSPINPSVDFFSILPCHTVHWGKIESVNVPRCTMSLALRWTKAISWSGAHLVASIVITSYEYIMRMRFSFIS